jgi:ketosteroid isomerase-like protein
MKQDLQSKSKTKFSMKSLIKIAIALSLIALSACQSDLTKTEMKKIIHERNEKLGELFKKGDAAELSKMYSDSAKLCPDGADLFIGRQAIRNFWTSAMEGSTLQEMNTQTLTVDGDANVIYETGKTTTKILFKDSVYTSAVKFANVWRKQTDGTYLLDVDIWNKMH